MTREEAITVLEGLSDNPLLGNQHKAAFNIAIHDIKQRHDWDINNLILINKENYEPAEQEPILDKYQAEIDHLHKYIARLETQITEEPFINKPCVSSGVCEHDKEKVLDKIRAEIAKYGSIMVSYAITKDTKTDKGIEKLVSGVLKQVKEQVLEVIDKYKSESEEKR